MSQPTTPPTTLYPDRRPALGLALLGLCAAMAGAWLAWRGWSFAGVAATVAGAVVLVGALIWLIPSRAYLHLTDRGFIYCTAFNPKRVDWADVARFGVLPGPDGGRVAWDYVPLYPADAISREQTKARTGFEAVLPRCCHLRGDRLAELLERRGGRASG
ncbi:hypothetical protein [Tautonia plasticadhaerens]|uniref:PH domain-containing protein n=1 Tax=Tautonia plasticadhaerens TaxID=2527974 RepID=A0A518H3P2_9BACT|nr:hypothetical protein [Tautonia plasticadhaerens]QDV35428.1 hypothetical protein ElP_33310 [Tautonia plasticadhaerens]